MTLAQTTATEAEPMRIGEYLLGHLRTYGLLFALIAIMIFFQKCYCSITRYLSQIMFITNINSI